MAIKRVTQLGECTGLADTDMFMIDCETNGTRRVGADKIKQYIGTSHLSEYRAETTLSDSNTTLPTGGAVTSALNGKLTTNGNTPLAEGTHGNFYGYYHTETNPFDTEGDDNNPVLQHSYSNTWKHQLMGDYRTGKVATRGMARGAWSDWKVLATEDGNVASATKLETPRNINGVPFDGTSDITIEASGGGIPIVPAIFNTKTYMGYDATVEGVTELTDGMKLTIIPDKAPIMAYYSLNVNGLGAKSIYRTNEKGLPANDPMSQQGWGEAGVPVTITYSVKGSKWIADVPFPTPAGIGAIAMQGGMASGLKVEALLLTKNSDYGDSLPTSVGAAGRIFFKKVT